MKAIVLDEYGSPDVLELREIDKPVVGDDEVLVRVHADCLHPDVRHMMRGMPYFLRIIGAGLRMPSNRVPGTDLAGSVEAVGRNVTQFRPGDDVFGENVSGHQWHNGGAFAEYVSAPEDTLALKPARLMFEQAAAVPTSGFIALQGVRDQGHVQPEQKVLINGAGGGVGTFAVQLAKSCGADVTGVDRTEKLDMIRSIGAGHVIDYTQEDFTRGGERYDLIVDVPGNHSLGDLRRALTPEGTYILIGHEGFGASGGRWIGRGLSRVLKLRVYSPFVSQQMAPPVSSEIKRRPGCLEGAPRIRRDHTGHRQNVLYPLSEVREAIRYLEEGSARGKVVITM
jgi:NADPH:quinone reductase-like Zn-dependent oxidoreductase